jgi:hypothetical protein
MIMAMIGVKMATNAAKYASVGFRDWTHICSSVIDIPDNKKNVGFLAKNNSKTQRKTIIQ